MTKLNTRAVAAKLSWQIIDKGQSLDAVLMAYFDSSELSAQDRGFVQELVYGVARWYGELDAIAATLLKSPIRNKDRVVHFILLVGLYQLLKLDTAEHAAVSETVAACKQLKKQWAKNLINGCLRNYQRHPNSLDVDSHRISHTPWMVEAIEAAWPEYSPSILSANNQKPPMCIRVNTMLYSRKDYLTELVQQGLDASEDPYAKDGIVLAEPCAVTALPGFIDGACSVQDTAAQISADLLNPIEKMTVLDACAAPGGKTAHLLERNNNKLEMDALDISERRCEQLHSTLTRLHLNANVISADASESPQWSVPAQGYDRILIDAPCSGLGVIRRHPDIKHHRRPTDIDQLEKVQAALLTNLWPLLKPAGQLLYMTCSILPRENQNQIGRFVASQNDAMLVPTTHPNALRVEYGVQTLPGVHEMDGFYYCLLEKKDH